MGDVEDELGGNDQRSAEQGVGSCGYSRTVAGRSKDGEQIHGP